MDTRQGRGQRADNGRQRARRPKAKHVAGVVVCLLLSAIFPVCVTVKAEIIDKVLAVMPGQIVTLSDLEAALDLGLVEPPPGSDRMGGGLTALVDRLLMLNEVRRVVPPEPSAAAIDERLALIRSRFTSPDEMSRMLATRGLDESVVRIYAADDLRLESYLDERFSAASQPTDEEIRQAGEGARARLVAERRQALVSAWVADLRRRADVTILP
jgi:hypothetical protein